MVIELGASRVGLKAQTAEVWHLTNSNEAMFPMFVNPDIELCTTGYIV